LKSVDIEIGHELQNQSGFIISTMKKCEAITHASKSAFKLLFSHCWSIVRQYTKLINIYTCLYINLLTLSPSYLLTYNTHTFANTTLHPIVSKWSSSSGVQTLTVVSVPGHSYNSHWLMRNVCSKHLGVTARVLVWSQHRPAGPVWPVDEVCIDGEPVEVPRSRFNNDLNIVEQRAHVRTALHHAFQIQVRCCQIPLWCQHIYSTSVWKKHW